MNPDMPNFKIWHIYIPPTSYLCESGCERIVAKKRVIYSYPPPNPYQQLNLDQLKGTCIYNVFI